MIVFSTICQTPVLTDGLFNPHNFLFFFPTLLQSQNFNPNDYARSIAGAVLMWFTNDITQLIEGSQITLSFFTNFKVLAVGCVVVIASTIAPLIYFFKIEPLTILTDSYKGN